VLGFGCQEVVMLYPDTIYETSFLSICQTEYIAVENRSHNQ